MDVIENLYNESSESIGYNYILPTLIICGLSGVIVYLYLQNTFKYALTDWEYNKCIPKYMFISGFIKQDSNYGIFESTYRNFQNCVQKLK